MDKHTHQWGIQAAAQGEPYSICGCGKTETHEEIDRRLNAIERLEKLIADLQDANDGPNEMGGPFVGLSVIARTLEED